LGGLFASIGPASRRGSKYTGGVNPNPKEILMDSSVAMRKIATGEDETCLMRGSVVASARGGQRNLVLYLPTSRGGSLRLRDTDVAMTLSRRDKVPWPGHSQVYSENNVFWREKGETDIADLNGCGESRSRKGKKERRADKERKKKRGL